MKTARLLVCCLLALPLVGTAPRSVSKDRAAKTLKSTPEQEALGKALNAAAGLFRAGRYAEAERAFDAVRRSALAEGLNDWAARAQANAGGCLFALHQYQAALKTFLAARRLATSAGDESASAAIDGNIASLYGAIGDLDPAAEWMQRALERFQGNDWRSRQDRRDQTPKLLMQLASARAAQNRTSEAFELFRQAIDAADSAGNTQLCATGWNQMGNELLDRGLPAEAEPYLLQAYHVRKLGRYPLDTSYLTLGRLRLLQGDLVSASILLDRAVELGMRPGGGLPLWDAYYYRGRVRLAQDRLPEALADLRVALRLARAWRRQGLGGDAGRIATESSVAPVYSALVEAGNRLYLRTREPKLIAETFEASEESRAASLRALAAENRSNPDLPPSYWDAISRLQRAEVKALRTGSAQAREAAGAARAELIRVEAETSSGAALTPGPVLDRIQGLLGSDTALLSFQLGDRVSWLWALDSGGLNVYALPPRRELEAGARAARDAVRRDAADEARTGAALYRALFGSLPARFREKSRWLLEPDGEVFEAPFSALPEQFQGEKPVRVAERRSVAILPGAALWADAASRGSRPPAGPFLGVGDPIYNAADPRLPKSDAGGQPGPFQLLVSHAAGSALVMPRLVASAGELDACAHAWGAKAVLLEGRDATRRRVEQELGRNPAVAHFATHVLESPQPPFYGLIALSRTARSEIEVLEPPEIARWRIQPGLIVLSGCHSSAGATLPGTGLLGLTRSWLAAGAGAVVASQWSTPDEQGALFSALYRNLRSEGRGAAEALRAAQLEMIGSGGWRSRPSYWAAYAAFGGPQ